MRRLKFHEKKLLKKVDFLQYKEEKTLQEAKIMRKFLIQKRDDYMKYNRLVVSIQQFAKQLMSLPTNDTFRIGLTQKVLDKLYSMGLLLSKNSLEEVQEKLCVSSFCRRRLPVVLVRLEFVQTLKEAVSFVEAGHVRVGAEIVNDPAFLVTRDMEDYIAWVDSSKIKRHIKTYNNEVDDFDLLFA